MTALITAADAAFPFDYTRLPSAVTVVLGYVGQPYCTPHVWTPDQVAAVRNHGKLWAPIHTPPQVPFTEQLGLQAGNLMLQELEKVPLLGAEPVFLDIERSSWEPNPSATMAGVRAWQSVMHAHGHPQAHAYLPWAAGDGWGANWTGAKPAAIPVGYVGWQYQGNADGGRYDLSVFLPSVFQDLINQSKGFPMNLDAEAQKWIVDQLNRVQHNLWQDMHNYHWGTGTPEQEPHANVHIHQAVTDLAAAVAKLGTGGVDVTALANALAAKLGPDLATRTAKVIGASLTNG